VPSLAPEEAEFWTHAVVALSHFMSFAFAQSAFVIGAANAGAVNATATPSTRREKRTFMAFLQTGCCEADCPSRTLHIKRRAGKGLCVFAQSLRTHRVADWFRYGLRPWEG
jgi:hypothetical protein